MTKFTVNIHNNLSKTLGKSEEEIVEDLQYLFFEYRRLGTINRIIALGGVVSGDEDWDTLLKIIEDLMNGKDNHREREKGILSNLVSSHIGTPDIKLERKIQIQSIKEENLEYKPKPKQESPNGFNILEIENQLLSGVKRRKR